MEWIDDFLADEECTLQQISLIESLFITSSTAEKYVGLDLTKLTYQEAQEIIYDLRENNYPTDPRDQYKQMFN